MKSSKTNRESYPTIVIGSGVAGLAAACRLVKQGKQVLVLESAPTYGGKIGEWKESGFRFDKGPSLFTLPHLLDEIFEDCGCNPRNYFEYYQLPVVTKYFYPDGQEIVAYADIEKFKHELQSKLGEDSKQLNRFFKRIEEVYDFVYPIFLDNPIRDFSKHLKGSIIGILKLLMKMGWHKSLDKSNRYWFKHPKAVQLFNRFATYNGSNPFKAPATLSVIPHLEHTLGAYYVKGGMRKVVDALYQLAKEQGVQFEFETTVEKISIQNGNCDGVYVGGQKRNAKKVFCNMDVNTAYPNLLSEQKQATFLLKQEKSTSALVFYWAMDLKNSPFDVHNVLFSDNYKEEFDCLSKGEISDDPTVYVYISSKVEELDAPEGKENWFVMINVPMDTGQDWDGVKRRAKENIIKKLNKQLGIDVSSHIMFEETLDPIKIQRETSSIGGALYGNNSNGIFAAFLRHPHHNKRFKNLYFVGGSVHPGGGVPLCLLSAKIAVNAT
ncbi:MAG: phytoene desaturase [Chitinophagales bacterium]|jgi:phytoene desaturase